MTEALVGLAGVALGVLLSEYFRRSSRVEVYSQQVFEKRLKIYEVLFDLVQDANDTATQVIDDQTLDAQGRLDLVSDAVMSLAEFTDKNELYLDQYVAAQAVAFVMGVEDIQTIEDENDRQAAIDRYRKGYNDTKELIAQESGVREVNKHFRKVSRSAPDSPIIRYMKNVEERNA